MAEDLDDQGEVVYLIKWDGCQSERAAHVEKLMAKPPVSSERCTFVWVLISCLLLLSLTGSGADTWEPFESIKSCKRALHDWKKEKASILASTAPSHLTEDGQLKYPIRHRQEAKVKAQKRSFASDQAWQERQIARAAELEKKQADRQRKEEARRKQKEREQAAAARRALTTKSVEPSSGKLTAAEKKAREEAQRKKEEAIREANRLAREAELACTEPYYYVTADDSLLMTCMDSDEEEEW
jgi:hypothetical protein